MVARGGPRLEPETQHVHADAGGRRDQAEHGSLVLALFAYVGFSLIGQVSLAEQLAV